MNLDETLLIFSSAN